MDKLKEKYKVDRTENSLSIQPFNYYKTRWKWYGITFLVVGLLTPVLYRSAGENIFIIGVSILVLSLFYFVKDFLKSKVKYTFDAVANSVSKSSPWVHEKKLMRLDEVVIFQSSEMGNWHYSIGPKRNHLVKNYVISEDFGNDKKSEERIITYEQEVLSTIDNLIEKVSTNKL